MKREKEKPPSVCKTEDGGGETLNTITREEQYHSAQDLSSGGSPGNQLKSLRVLYSLAAKDMAETVQHTYPRFDRYLLSKCEASDQYGIEIRRDALKALYMKYAPEAWRKRRNRDRHKRRRSIRCRLDEATYQALVSLIHEDGFDTVQDWLESQVIVFVAMRRRRRE